MADLSIPPQNIGAEEALLGSLIIDDSAIIDVSPVLQQGRDEFYVVKNGWIFEAIRSLNESSRPVDSLTLANEIERQKRGRFNDCGGESYLAQLVNCVPTAMNAVTYAQIVSDCFIRRRLLNAASEIARVAYDESLPTSDAVGRADAAVGGVSEGRNDSDVVTSRHAMPLFMESLQMRYENRGQLLGSPTGFPDWDKLTSGLVPTEFGVIAGRPGMGKTAMMLALMFNAAFRHRTPCAFFSMEMGIESLIGRMVSSETGIDSRRLRVGDLRDDEWANATKISLLFADAPMFFDDTVSISPAELRAKCRRLVQRHGVKVVFVDYVQLMESPGKGGRDENRVQEVSHITRSLKKMAMELGICVVAGSQLSRALEQRSNKRPLLADLRESGSIEQDTDWAAFLYRDEVYNPDTEDKNMAEVIFGKNRNGPRQTIRLFFDSRLTAFKNLAREKIEL